ncbi:tRNA 2-thiouridine(34) synthase MnmA [Patescibacteria group bacterium]|nr:tRNA 2-thiouridine(34) synthase MnmA [Patescibacteria group bacterium]
MQNGQDFDALKNARIFVGLSGGVDSAVSAALLQKTGAAITGVFIKGWYPPDMPCTWADDRRDAMRVAAFLRIPFYTLDASVEYKKGVIDYLIGEYAQGRTPNPDIMCNREVKFGAYYSFARSKRVDFIATGHYARVAPRELQHATAPSPSRLLRGINDTKDQSYFLWAVPKETIDHTLFPLGEFKKERVRELAKEYKLPVAEKKDSQGICFLGSISVDDFLRQELSPEDGKAIDAEGKEVGIHEGAVLYTLGQRLSLKNAPEGPWYVLKKDMHENMLTVGSTADVPAITQNIHLTQTNWFSDTSIENEILQAQYRYHGPTILGTLNKARDIFTLNEPLLQPIAGGQSLVLYREDECLGGGIIA